MIEEVPIKKLKLWSKNPRLDHQLRKTNPQGLDSEEIVMLELWEEVGDVEMNKLAKYINSKGLFDDEIVIAVKNGDNYDVFDGNRRVAAVKYIISDKCDFKEKKFNDESKIKISIMNEEEAYDRIFVKHAGEKALRNIAWEAYSRDCGLFASGKCPKYPKAFEFCQENNLGKQDFNIVKYTDLEGILGNNSFIELLLMYREDDEIWATLKELKTKLKFPAYSRYLSGFANDESKKSAVENVLSNLMNFGQKKKKEKKERKEFEKDEFFLLEKTKYMFKFGFPFDLMKEIKFTQEPTSKKEISFSCKTVGVIDKKGKCNGNIPMSDYEVMVKCGTYTAPINILIKSEKKKEIYCVIENQFYVDTYKSHMELSHPIAYVMRFLATTEIKDENIYVLTILLRQYMEFFYKLYCEKMNNSRASEIIQKNLSGGIDYVNNAIWLKDNTICTKATKSTMNSDVKRLIQRVQENAHNIDDITSGELMDLFKLIKPFLSYMLVEISGQK